MTFLVSVVISYCVTTACFRYIDQLDSGDQHFQNTEGCALTRLKWKWIHGIQKNITDLQILEASLMS